MQSAIFYSLTILIWGSTWYAIKLQLGSVDVVVSVGYRFALAALLLMAWCAVRGVRMTFSRSEHIAMGCQGIFLFALNYVLFYWCSGYITSGVVAIIFSTVIVMNIINGALFLKKPVETVVLLGALIGLSGITLVFWHEIELARTESQAASKDVFTGLAFGLVATLSASFGNILSSRNQSKGLPVLQTNAYGMAYGAALTLLYAMLSGASFSMEWSVNYIGSLIYLSIFGSIVAFGAYLSLVGRIGADRAAYATVLFPLVALMISSVLEDYLWTTSAIVGIVLILIGNVLVLGRGLGSR